MESASNCHLVVLVRGSLRVDRAQRIGLLTLLDDGVDDDAGDGEADQAEAEGHSEVDRDHDDRNGKDSADRKERAAQNARPAEDADDDSEDRLSRAA